MKNLKIINFNTQGYKPDYKITKGKYPLIEWGSKNDYPTWLLDLFNFRGSNLHHSIITKKVMMIASEGFIETDENSQIIKNEFDSDDLNSIGYKLAYDAEVFNGFAYEVIRSNGGEIVQVKHIPFQNIRIGVNEDTGEVGEYFWVCDDWSQYKKKEYEPVAITAYDAESRDASSLVYVQYYNPQNTHYPVPYYSNAMNWIEMDYEIANFHLNNTKNGYQPSFILNFSTGIPTEEEMDEVERQFKNKFRGTDNAGAVIITYSDGQESKPELLKVEMNDSDERFVNLDKQLQQNVLTAHQVTSPTLFGIYKEGSLGDKNNLVEALDIFNSTYITKRRRLIETSLTEILGVELLFNPFLLEEIEEEVVEEEAIDINTQKQAELRGSVGGVQGLLQIQESVLTGITSRSSAIATLELIYGFTNEESNRLLGDVEEGDNNENNLIVE